MPSSTWVRLTNLREVECFLAVAETLHFGRAAERLHIPQPHLSRIIRRLERRLGVDLFDRTSRRVELSPAGRIFAEEAQALWYAAERTSRRVQLAAAGAAGTLSIGFVPWAAFHGLPSHVMGFKDKYPDVHVELREDSPGPLCEQVLQHTLDLAYVRPIHFPELEFHEVAVDAFRVVVPADHRWSRLEEIPLDLLGTEPFVCVSRDGGGMYNYEVLMEPLAAAGCQPDVTIEAPSVTAAIAFVRAGAGFTLITTIHQVLAPDLAFIRIAGVEPRIRLVIATRRSDTDPLGDAYLEYLQPAQAARNGC